MASDLFFNQKESHTWKIFGPVNMHESKDSTENISIEASNGNLAHRRRLAKL